MNLADRVAMHGSHNWVRTQLEDKAPFSYQRLQEKVIVRQSISPHHNQLHALGPVIQDDDWKRFFTG